MPSFSFILLTVSEKKNLEKKFSKIYPLCRPDNQSIQAIWTKAIRNMEDYSINIYVKNKNSVEVDIASAFGEITAACNVGQAKKGHGACLKSGQLVYAVEREIKVKGTRSRYLLKECLKDNYYARFHPHS